MAKKKENKFNSEYIRLSYSAIKEIMKTMESARNQDYDEHGSIDNDHEDYITIYPDGKVITTAYYKTYCDKESIIDIEHAYD